MLRKDTKSFPKRQSSRSDAPSSTLPTAAVGAAVLSASALAGTSTWAVEPVHAQSMISFETPGIDLPPGARYSSMSTGDFDGDGDIDLLVMGLYRYGYDYVSVVYENTGQNQGSGSLDGTTFQDIGAGLTEVSGGYGSTAVGDLDGDGDLDLVVAGYYYDGTYGGALLTTIYENTGQNQGAGSLDSNTFQAVGAGLTGVRGGSVAMGDFDGDADLDLLVTGEDANGIPTATLYENTGQNQGAGTLGTNTFQDVGANITGTAAGSVVTGDFDGDADLDLVVTGGASNGDPSTTLYENTGQNQGSGTLGTSTFQPVGAGLTGVELGDTAAGDLDGDGDLEVLITGYDASFDPQTTLYENTGQNQGAGTLGPTTFQPVATGLPNIGYTSISVADFEADGDLDLLLTGGDALIQAEIYENTGQNQGSGTLGSSTFQATGTGLKGVELGASVTADFDGDLDLDLLITGSDDTGADTGTIYDNTSNNPIPVELVAFTVKQEGNGALLQWTTASEENNAGFEVQQLIGSPGSGLYQSLGFVDGAGTTSEAQSYRFRTDALRAGRHRFRLKQIDLDGSAEYSDVITIGISISEVYRLQPPSPNPAMEGAQIRLTVEQAQTVRVSVLDLLGREVQVPFDGTLSPQTERSIRVGSDLVPGIYFVRVQGERFRATERLAIIR